MKIVGIASYATTELVMLKMWSVAQSLARLIELLVIGATGRDHDSVGYLQS